MVHLSGAEVGSFLVVSSRRREGFGRDLAGGEWWEGGGGKGNSGWGGFEAIWGKDDKKIHDDGE